MKEIVRTFKHLQARRYIKLHEQKYEDEVKYIFVPKKSDVLMVVFSGFTGENRRYNYLSSFKYLPINQLYILDTWGYKGSYYWLENGSTRPEELVSMLITKICQEKSIKHIYTAGSSKGGTAAIYYGLKHSADYIYSGACQFLVGSYLSSDKHMDILNGMIGQLDKNIVVKELDEKVENEIAEHKDSHAIHLFYSTEELTYEKQIIPLKDCLNRYGVFYSETIEKFPSHSDVGLYFPKFVQEQMSLHFDK